MKKHTFHSLISYCLVFLLLLSVLSGCTTVPEEPQETEQETTQEQTAETTEQTTTSQTTEESTADPEEDSDSKSSFTYTDPDGVTWYGDKEKCIWYPNDRIAVCIKDKYLEDKEYTVADFSEIDCIDVVRSKYNYIEESGQLISIKPYIIYLKEKSIDAVYRAIANLKGAMLSGQREDISVVSFAYDAYFTVDLAPNDALYTSNAQWAIDKISLPSAWDIVTGRSTVKVGVIDTGVDGTHADLSDRVDNSLSKSFVNSSQGLSDSYGHGTHVAGIIGAHGNNSVGVTGTCWNVDIVSIQAGTGQYLNPYAVIAAIEYATQEGIPIINCSFSTTSSSYKDALKPVIENYPGLIVCVAGNKNKNVDESEVYPAAFDLPNIIVVGSTTSGDAKASDSNYGKTNVDLFAPGCNILSTFPTNMCTNNACNILHFSDGYHYSSGTSMAAPYVTGVAALMLTANPSLTTAQLKSLLMENVDTVSGLSDYCVSGGRLNAYKAVQAADALHVHTCSDWIDTGSWTHKGTCEDCGRTTYGQHQYVQNGTTITCSQCGNTFYLNRVEDQIK